MRTCVCACVVGWGAGKNMFCFESKNFTRLKLEIFSVVFSGWVVIERNSTMPVVLVVKLKAIPGTRVGVCNTILLSIFFFIYLAFT